MVVGTQNFNPVGTQTANPNIVHCGCLIALSAFHKMYSYPELLRFRMAEESSFSESRAVLAARREKRKKITAYSQTVCALFSRTIGLQIARSCIKRCGHPPYGARKEIKECVGGRTGC